MKHKDQKLIAAVVAIAIIILDFVFVGIFDNINTRAFAFLNLVAIILFCYAFIETSEKKKNKIKTENLYNDKNITNEENEKDDSNYGNNKIEINETTKTCKYCKTEIRADATVCPNCRKTQNFSFGRVLLGVTIGLIILYFVFVANNDAPLEVRKVVCGLGLRDDYPYCYYVDTDKLNEILNK